MKHLLLIPCATLLWGGLLRAQEEPAAGEGDPEQRVDYDLILPEEKTPEMVKPEENNPFESSNFDMEVKGDTEENTVRDILLRLPVNGTTTVGDRMRVLLGSMRLEAGMLVPPMIPDQQVQLRVRDITPTAIELVWVEKRPSGLPEKPLVIQIDAKPRVRYQLPAATNPDGTGGSMGSMTKDAMTAFSQPFERAPNGQTVAMKTPSAPATVPAAAVTNDGPGSPAAAPAEPPPTTPPSAAPEASVLRMLFGNKAFQSGK